MSSDELRSTAAAMIKFMCSHGGTILPRLGDGKLKYVGGETRMVAVPPNLHFSELMKKLDALVDGEIQLLLKYQANSEDLDALVTVRSNEDLKLMLEDFKSIGPPIRRVFLYPTNPASVNDNLTNLTDPLTLQLRYIEAINGVSTNAVSRTRPSFTISTCTSPRSNISPETRIFEPIIQNKQQQQQRHVSKHPMQRVQSSPNLNLNSHVSQTGNGVSNQNAYTTSSHVHYNPSPHHHVIQSSIPHPQVANKVQQDYYGERNSSASGLGSHELVRIPTGAATGSQFYTTGRYMSSS